MGSIAASDILKGSRCRVCSWSTRPAEYAGAAYEILVQHMIFWGYAGAAESVQVHQTEVQRSAINLVQKHRGRLLLLPPAHNPPFLHQHTFFRWDSISSTSPGESAGQSFSHTFRFLLCWCLWTPIDCSETIPSTYKCFILLSVFRFYQKNCSSTNIWHLEILGNLWPLAASSLVHVRPE